MEKCSACSGGVYDLYMNRRGNGGGGGGGVRLAGEQFFFYTFDYLGSMIR